MNCKGMRRYYASLFKKEDYMNGIITKILMLAVFALAGAYLNKVKKIGMDSVGILSSLVINLATPCIIVSSFIKIDGTRDVKQMGMVALCAVAMFSLLAALGFVFAKFMRQKSPGKGLVVFLVMFSNNIFMGFPVIEEMLGKGALKYASLLCIPYNAILFSFGIFLISRQKDEFEFQWKKMMNVCVLASAMAAIIYVADISFPKFLEQSIISIGNISIPLAIIILGITISEISIVETIKDYRCYLFCIVKLIVAPLLLWLIVPLFVNDTTIVAMIVITAAMPSGNISIMLSEEYGNDTVLATKYVSMSTVASMFTIPLICELLL